MYFGVAIAAAACWAGVLIMSVLGAEEFSFHIISIEDGWAAELWDILWMGFTATSFFLIGALFNTFTTNKKGSEDE